MGRERRRRPGRGLTEQQDRFVRLIAQGVSNSEACRIVGINRTTGTRWRYGRKVRNSAGDPVQHPPVRSATLGKPRHPRYLSLHERTVIADLRRDRMTVRQIAVEIGRSPATVSRELRRNTDDTGRYLSGVADRLALARVRRPRQRRIVIDDDLRIVVNGLLAKRWSPEQVAHELRHRFPDNQRRWLSVESIYQAIYDSEVSVCRPAKRRRRRRRRRVQGLERRGRLTSMTMIADRPAEVADRIQIGHWEGDCIMGPGNASAVGTLIERRTRFTMLIHRPTARPTAAAMREGLTEAFAGLPPPVRRTLTWDQGKELAGHLHLTADTGVQVSFCDAHSPWQRGTNENTNGLLRDYFPKGTDLRAITPDQLAAVAAELNDRPRKTSAGRAQPTCSPAICSPGRHEPRRGGW